MCHTRELAFQISKEYERFSKYMPTVKVSVFFGGMAIKKDEEVLKKNCPHIVVGTPGRTLALIAHKSLNLKNIKHFVLDECDKMLEQLGEWQEIFLIFKWLEMNSFGSDFGQPIRLEPSCWPRYCTLSQSLSFIPHIFYSFFLYQFP